MLTRSARFAAAAERGHAASFAVASVADVLSPHPPMSAETVMTTRAAPKRNRRRSSRWSARREGPVSIASLGLGSLAVRLALGGGVQLGHPVTEHVDVVQGFERF